MEESQHSTQTRLAAEKAARKAEREARRGGRAERREERQEKRARLGLIPAPANPEPAPALPMPASSVEAPPAQDVQAFLEAVPQALPVPLPQHDALQTVAPQFAPAPFEEPAPAVAPLQDIGAQPSELQVDAEVSAAAGSAGDAGGDVPHHDAGFPASAGGTPSTRAYNIPEDALVRINEASRMKDLSPRTRSKLHMALNRQMDNPAAAVPAEIIAKWASAKKDKSGKLQLDFLREWSKDTASFSGITITQAHSQKQETYSTSERRWFTRGGLIAELNAWGSEEGRAYAEKLLAAAKVSRPHPDFPRDRSMRMYHILASAVDGVRMSHGLERMQHASGSVQDAHSVELTLEAVRHTVNPAAALEAEAPEEQAGTPPRRRGGAKSKAKAAKESLAEAPASSSTVPAEKTRGQACAQLKRRVQHKYMEMKKTIVALKAKLEAGLGTEHDQSIERGLDAVATTLQALDSKLENVVLDPKACSEEDATALKDSAESAVKRADTELRYARGRLRAM